MIDLRSDTVSLPTTAMKQAMIDAPLGDDVYGDDPTVNQLEDYAADLLGKEAALLVSSGTQSNLCALLSHCGRGEEYLAGDMAHIYRWEAGGGAVFGSIQPQPLPMLADGLVDPAAIGPAVKPEDPHYARSRLLCLENTKDGMVQSIERMNEALSVGRAHGLATHLDGARMWNAIVDLGVAADEFCAGFDTVSMCLSKGLGAPMGSLLIGPGELINEARRWRKMAGGGLRQAGMIAAAGRYALEHHVERLANDHANARRLAEGLATIDGVEILAQNTNMVFVNLDNAPADLDDRLEASGVRTRWTHHHGLANTRLVTHLGISDDDIATVIAAVAGAR